MGPLTEIQRTKWRGSIVEYGDILRAARPRLHPGILVREAQQLQSVVGGPFHVLVSSGVFEPAVLVPLEVVAVTASKARLKGIRERNHESADNVNEGESEHRK